MTSPSLELSKAPGRDRTSAYRIAVGAGFAGDRYDPAEELAAHGDLDALVFECLAERTIGLAHQALRSGTSSGFDPRLIRRLRTTLPAIAASGGVIVTNAGAANPVAAAKAVAALVGELGVGPMPVAAVLGDDVLPQLDLAACQVIGTDYTLADYADRIVSANAYTGAAGVIAALHTGARVVITGRTSDAALFLGPLAVHHGWDLDDDLDEIAQGLLIGHLLECGGQLTGGYYADGPDKKVPGLARLGFPYADVDREGTAIYRKLAGTGGRLDRSTVIEQLLYEIDDPTRYITPDGVLDLSGVEIVENDVDVVTVSGASIGSVPDMLKVSVGIDDGYLGAAEIMYAGTGCRDRADLAAEILRERWRDVHDRNPDELDCAVIGVNAARPWWHTSNDDTPEVRLRASVRALNAADAAVIAEEVEALYTNGPAGGGGVTSSVRQTTGIVSTMIAKTAVEMTVETVS